MFRLRIVAIFKEPHSYEDFFYLELQIYNLLPVKQ